MPAKSSRAFRTISEASDELDLKPHVLRFWEAKFPDLQPITRGGGRRFYRHEDIDFLRGLRILLHDEKHKIKDVQKLISKRGADSVVELGQSAVNKHESRPIEQRDLVPDRIKPIELKPSPQAETVFTPPPAQEQAPTAQPSIPAQPILRPIAQAVPQAIPVAAPALQPAPVPAITTEDARRLEASLNKLTALRERWKAFAS